MAYGRYDNFKGDFMEFIVFLGIFIFIQVFLIILLKPMRFKCWQWGGIQFLITYLLCFIAVAFLVGSEGGEAGMVLLPFLIPIGFLLMSITTNLWFAGLMNSFFYILLGIGIGFILDYLKVIDTQ